MCENPMRPEPCLISKIIKETDIEWTFRIKIKEKPLPGQFYMVSLPRIGEMPISISSIEEGFIEMTIRNVGKVSDKVHHLQEGSQIFLRGPYGNGFDMTKFRDKHLVIAAGGSGVSPVKPIIEYFYKNPDQIKNVDLLFGYKEPNAVLFKPEIDSWKNKFNTIVTVDKGDDNWKGNVGLITKFVDKINVPKVQDLEVVIVGPPIMMKFTALEFMKMGIDEEQITVSYERRMSCGIGKCGHCRIGQYYVCADGPIFSYKASKELID
ncbi:MAG TPA: anaerobic sulfite reductase subunit AsrB [Victivallales bacterium]|nr:anaerobic sulfite reductase subunit AsrB [Victivallales bacterium]